MANNYQILSEDSIKYLCGLIRDLASVSEGIDNINLADDKTFSNIYIKNLIDKCLEDANAEAEKLVGALTHLTCEETAIQPTLDNSEINVIYLYSANGNPPYQQFLKISDTKLVDLGSTSINLTDYLTATEIANTYAKQVDLTTLTDKVAAIKDEIGTETLTTTSTTIKGAINEVADKSEIVTLTKDEYEALTPKDTETYYITTDDMTMYKGESQVLGGKSLVGKETVLYEGKITATGTYTLADDVNNYDLIVINHRQASGVNCESTTLSKYEISKCIDYEHKFMCVLGYGSSEDCISGYFNNDKLILSTYNNQNITSITGYKFGEVTVQNTITNPSPAASYSTDEQLTGGTWIDGKPIYRKVVNFGALPSRGNIKSVSSGISNIEQIVSLKGMSYSPTENAYIPLPFSNVGDDVALYYHLDNIVVQVKAEYINTTGYTTTYITIEYTKN